MTYTMPQQRKKEESERLRGERDQIEFIGLGFERWQVVRLRKARGRQDVTWDVCSDEFGGISNVLEFLKPLAAL